MHREVDFVKAAFWALYRGASLIPAVCIPSFWFISPENMPVFGCEVLRRGCKLETGPQLTPGIKSFLLNVSIVWIFKLGVTMERQLWMFKVNLVLLNKMGSQKSLCCLMNCKTIFKLCQLLERRKDSWWALVFHFVPSPNPFPQDC